MGVYIKGMMMPRNCGTCEFRYFKKDECSWYSCSLLPSDIDEGSNGADIQNNCPLVELPVPHGRLVDADMLAKKMREGQRTSKMKVWTILAEMAPTIIESEEK